MYNTEEKTQENVWNSSHCTHPNIQSSTSAWSHENRVIRVGGEDDTQNHHYHPENKKEALGLSSLSYSWQNICWNTAENFTGLEETLKKYKHINEYQQWEINSFKCFVQPESLCSQIHCQDEDLEGFCQLFPITVFYENTGHTVCLDEKNQCIYRLIILKQKALR